MNRKEVALVIGLLFSISAGTGNTPEWLGIMLNLVALGYIIKSVVVKE